MDLTAAEYVACSVATRDEDGHEIDWAEIAEEMVFIAGYTVEATDAAILEYRRRPA